MKKTYSDDFKQEAVKRVAMGGETIGAIAKSLGVSPNSIHNWKKQYPLLPVELIEPPVSDKKPDSEFVNKFKELLNKTKLWVLGGEPICNLVKDGDRFGLVQRTIMYFTNFQWRKSLNLWENIVFNTLLPGSNGKRSVHLTFAFVILASLIIFTYMEINENGMLSTEGWIVWGILANVVVVLFSKTEKHKRENGFPKEEDE